MANETITPKTAEDLYKILSSLKQGLTAALITKFGITTDETDNLEHDKDNCNWIINFHSNLLTEKEGVTSFKDALLFGEIKDSIAMFTITAPTAAPFTLIPGIWARTSALIQKIKVNTQYTKAIGESLGIVGPEIVIDWDTAKPKASLKANLANKVSINVVKGYADRIAVYRYTYKQGEQVPDKPGSELTYDLIGSFSSPPFEDFTLNQAKSPETRLYKFYFMKGDKIVGVASDTIRVVAEVYMAVDGSELSGKVKTP